HPRKCPGDGAGRALLGELPHGLLEAADGDGVHPAAHDLLDHGDRLAVLPDALGLRVEPGVLGEALDEPTQPDGARLLVVVLHRAAGLEDLVGAHRRIAHEDQPVVGVELAQDVPGGRAFRVATAVVLPHVIVDAVVEVVELEVLELGSRRGKELLGLLDVVVHRAADVEQHQHLDRVVALRDHLDVEIARVSRRRGDGVVEVELFLGAFAGELAQPAQRDLDVARAQLDAVVVVAVGALLPHLDRGAVAGRRSADADALGVVAAIAERRGSVGAQPLVAALVALLLLLEDLAQPLHQLVEAAQGLDRGLLLGGELALHHPPEPLLGDVERELGDRFDALEVGAERAVELVEVALVLDERGLREMVEVVDRRGDDLALHGFEQHQVFLDRDGQLGAAQVLEEVDQHRFVSRQGCGRRASLASRWRRTAGHSLSMIENTTVSRRLPSARRWWLRRTPSCLAPSRAIAWREAWLNQWVRNSTAMQSSVSKACPSSRALHSVLSAVRWTEAAYHVVPISSRRCRGSMFMYRVDPTMRSSRRRRTTKGRARPASRWSRASAIQSS